MAIDAPVPAPIPPEAASGGAASAVNPSTERKERLREIRRALLRNKTFMIGVIILVFWVFDAIFWKLYAPYDPQLIAVFPPLDHPSSAHLFGTDNLGRDMFSRVLAGSSSVLSIAPAATALGLLGGIIVGLIAGYYRGVVDEVLMRIVDALLAFPLIIIAVLVLTVLGSSAINVVIVIGIVFTPIIARTVRAAVLVEREREYVAAAKLLGAPAPFIMAREILPNITGPIVVEGTVRLGYAIFTSATLSFLSLGIQPPSPDWGLTIAQDRNLVQVAPWTVLFPALALATLVIALNFVADGLREVLAE